MERYFEEKKLKVNVGKTKMMIFRKGGGRYKKMEWRWRKCRNSSIWAIKRT